MTLLIRNLLDNSKHLLEEFGEFYPFAMVVNSEGTVQPLNYFDGNNTPKADEYFRKLQYSLLQKDSEGFTLYKSYGIAIDANINDSPTGKTKEVVRIKLTYNQEPYEDCFVPYIIDKRGKVHFQDMHT